MTDSYPADTEHKEFVKWLPERGNQQTPEFVDPLFRRCVHAHNSESSRDFLVLLRQVMRRYELETEHDAFTLEVSEVDAEIADEIKGELGITILRSENSVKLTANAWEPEWLEGSKSCPPDSAAIAGYPSGERAEWRSQKNKIFPADKFFQDVPTGGAPYTNYRTIGQRNAVRAAVSMPEDGTLLAILPTGSGKTQIAEALAWQCQSLTTKKTVLLIVPTVALAFDLESRFRQNYSQKLKGLKGPLEKEWAWTGNMEEEHREFLAKALQSGMIPLLVTSPESLTTNSKLSNALRDAVSAGTLGALVIDEAHLYTQWGRDFRPQYREVGRLRKNLLDSVQGPDNAFKTVCMSATMGSTEILDLYSEFAQPDKTSFVVDNFFRPEPDIWIGSEATHEKREEWVLEAINHLPRPLFLYVSYKKDTSKWFNLLKEQGYERLAVVDGNTDNQERKSVLERLKLQTERGVDIVIATSAFGLGIDCDDVRSIVHACIPETLDRWYQEIGRAGRDGYRSVAMLIPATEGSESEKDDLRKARSLSTSALTRQKAHRRWEALFDNRIVTNTPGSFLVDVRTEPEGLVESAHDIRWNRVVLQGLESLGNIKREYLTQSEWKKYDVEGNRSDFERITFLKANELKNTKWWGDNWENYIGQINNESRKAYDLMKKVVTQGDNGVSICEGIRQSYLPPKDLLKDFDELHNLTIYGGCGHCPDCRFHEIEPVIHDPYSSSQWKVKPLSEKKRRVIDDCMSIFPKPEKPMIVLPSSNKTLIDEFYRFVMKLGFLWFGGVIPENFGFDGKIWFHDAHPNQYDVPNVPGVCNLGTNLDEVQRWFAHSFNMPMFLLTEKRRNTNKEIYKFEENELEIATVLAHFRSREV